MHRLLITLACVFLLAACSTTSVGLKYIPDSTPTKITFSEKTITIGSFVDQRGVGPNWLGAIRGGFGNPLKTLETDQPVSNLVQIAFADGLSMRGASINTPSSALQLSGIINRLDCDQMMAEPVATAKVEVSVTEVTSGKRLFNKSYTADNVGDRPSYKWSTGLQATVEDLRLITEKTLCDVVDKALDDPSLHAALQ